jgi:hypothetical protein
LVGNGDYKATSVAIAIASLTELGNRRLLRNKLLEPIIMPDMKKCEYEKIRDNIIAQRKIEWSELEKKWDMENN